LTEAEGKKIIEIINNNKGIAMAAETLSNVTQDEIEYARMTTLIKSELDWHSEINYAHNEEGKLDVARNFKKMGLSVSQIAEGTGLSTETIAQL